MQNNSLNMEIGQRIRKMRCYQKKSRERLAEEADISVQFLADIELGKKSMTTNVLQRMCKALCVSADWLLFEKQTEKDHAGILAMLDSLTDAQKEAAEELLALFIRTAIQKK